MPGTDDEAKRPSTVLVVDDTKENLTVIGMLLRPFYHVRVANSGMRALEIVETTPLPDLILLDVMMPEMSGHDVLRALKSRPLTRDIPVIFVTAMDAAEDEEYGLSLGAVDYVAKPVKPALLLARVRAHLEIKAARDRLSDQNAYLDAEVRRRMVENELVKDFSLHALATLAEKRDNETGNHLHRTQAYVRALMENLKEHPRFSGELGSPALCDRIAKAAPLHDIGKVGIPDAILLKPGKLTPQEFEIMKTHATIGAQAIGEAIRNTALAAPEHASSNPDEQQTAQALDFLETTRQIAESHHEKWDGSGYPQGLQGDAIPLAARLMAVADVFDALVSRRHYKHAYPLDETVRIMQDGRATHFDPDILDTFLQLTGTFAAIAQRYADHPDTALPETT